MHNSIYLVYLGRKGSGLNFTHALFNELVENGIDVDSLILNSNNKGIEKLPQNKAKVFNFNQVFFVSFLQSLTFAFRFMSSLESKANSIVVFPMSSPLDIFLSIFLKIRKISNFRFIHEAKSHLGESWPDPFSNWILVGTATHLVTLSSFEQTQLLKFYKRTSIKVSHPVFDSPLDFNPNLIKVEKIILFVGRIKKYKGIPTLIRAWESLDDSGYRLRICGEGKIPEVEMSKSLELDNRWLTEVELHTEICRAEIIVFPYLEASQSGLIPIAISKGKKIVLTPVGGLIEQIGNYENAFVAVDTSVESLSAALNEAMKSYSQCSPEAQGYRKGNGNFSPLISFLK